MSVRCPYCITDTRLFERSDCEECHGVGYLDEYQQDEWHGDNECPHCGTEFDGEGWCPFCDYPLVDADGKPIVIDDDDDDTQEIELIPF